MRESPRLHRAQRKYAGGPTDRFGVDSRCLVSLGCVRGGVALSGIHGTSIVGFVHGRPVGSIVHGGGPAPRLGNAGDTLSLSSGSGFSCEAEIRGHLAPDPPIRSLLFRLRGHSRSRKDTRSTSEPSAPIFGRASRGCCWRLATDDRPPASASCRDRTLRHAQGFGLGGSLSTRAVAQTLREARSVLRSFICLALKARMIPRFRARVAPQTCPSVDARGSNLCEMPRMDLDEHRPYRHGAAKPSSPWHFRVFSPTNVRRFQSSGSLRNPAISNLREHGRMWYRSFSQRRRPTTDERWVPDLPK